MSAKQQIVLYLAVPINESGECDFARASNVTRAQVLELCREHNICVIESINNVQNCVNDIKIEARRLHDEIDMLVDVCVDITKNHCNNKDCDDQFKMTIDAAKSIPGLSRH